MKIRGINYDVGTEYRPGESSRAVWNEGDVVRDLRAIRDELSCSHVNFYGTDLERLRAGTMVAHREGLHVSFQLRSIDDTRAGMLARLEEAADAAERLRRHGEVTLNVGCELTLFTRGFVPGKTFRARITNLLWTLPFLPIVNARLNRHLAEAVRVARGRFGGAITYSAGAWESVNWTGFDFVGVNLYRDRWNERSYRADLRRLCAHGKPVIITEFGCSTYEGAERAGGGGWMIVDFDAVPPAVKPGYRRSEQAQAQLLGELLDLYVDEQIHGAYVFDFMAATFGHDDSSPLRDLDMASYGLVKVRPGRPGDASIRWERKAGFDAIAQRYGLLGNSPP